VRARAPFEVLIPTYNVLQTVDFEFAMRVYNGQANELEEFIISVELEK
jgi:hypothetical protein